MIRVLAMLYRCTAYRLDAKHRKARAYDSSAYPARQRTEKMIPDSAGAASSGSRDSYSHSIVAGGLPLMS